MRDKYEGESTGGEKGKPRLVQKKVNEDKPLTTS